MKEFIYKYFISWIFKEFIDSSQVSAEVIMMTRTLTSVDPRDRRALLQKLAEQTVLEVAIALVEEDLIDVTHEFVGTGNDINVKITATLKVYRP